MNSVPVKTTIPLEQLIQMREDITQGEWTTGDLDGNMVDGATYVMCVDGIAPAGHVSTSNHCDAKAIAALPTILDILIERENKLRELVKEWRNEFADVDGLTVEQEIEETVYGYCADELELLLES